VHEGVLAGAAKPSRGAQISPLIHHGSRPRLFCITKRYFVLQQTKRFDSVVSTDWECHCDAGSEQGFGGQA
jgi:hypothetical protein